MRRYLLTFEAKEDLVSIRKYITSEASLRVAQASIKKIVDTFDFLSRTPGAGHLREDLTDDNLKFWSVFSYLIVYDHTSKPIEIMRIIHGSRDVSAILQRED